MPIVFLNPWGALLVLLLVLPLVAFARLRRRDAQVRATLGFAAPSRAALYGPIVAVCVAGTLLVLAATQPALVRSSSHRERTDAEALFVLDISRSMLASATRDSETRLDRAKRIASRLRKEIASVPAGVASITDRVLPYVLATSDQGVFASTLTSAVAVDEPPPTNVYYDRATDLGALDEIPARRFFSPTAHKRLLVVLTDGESRGVSARKMQALAARRLRTVFVHVWQPDERVFATGRPDKTYHADPNSGTFLARLAEDAGGATAEEDELPVASAAVRRAIGSGPTEAIPDHSYRGLMWPLVALALLPLAFAVWRRNGWVVRRTYTLANERREEWSASQRLLSSPQSRL